MKLGIELMQEIVMQAQPLRCQIGKRVGIPATPDPQKSGVFFVDFQAFYVEYDIIQSDVEDRLIRLFGLILHLGEVSKWSSTE